MKDLKAKTITFCSHLAMHGPPIAIKELAGHRDLSTTMKYLHLPRSPQPSHQAPGPGPRREVWRHSGDARFGHRQLGGGAAAPSPQKHQRPRAFARGLRSPGDDQDL